MKPAVTPWVTAWASCDACSHEWVVVRPLVVPVGWRPGPCSQCGSAACTDNGPTWKAAAEGGGAVTRKP